MNDTISPAEPADMAAVIETLAQAFQTDPALSWILPDDAHRARALRGLFRVLVPADGRAGVVLRSANDEAASLWRAPGQAHSGTLEFLRTVVPLVATFGLALPRGLKVQAGIDAQRPKGRFWYLHYVGVRSGSQGKGLAAGSSGPRRRLPMTPGCPAGWKPRRRKMCRCTSGWGSRLRSNGTYRAAARISGG
ncbi:MAG: GNAT family N-acetyltransferase [Sphingopyxis sp.]|uniref:GNAT family N-acetyltransferase n=1 Tax=Sphingopyxis sp. TaxID=1908224 RepID=UPI003D6CB057